MQSKWTQRVAIGMAASALFVAAGGPSYAASTINGSSIKSKSVSGSKLKNNTITSGKVKNGSLLSKDFKSGQLPAGPAGATGATGPAGSAAAYAHINADGTVDLAKSKNITNAMVFSDTAGVYCLRDLPAGIKFAMVTPDGFNPDDNNVAVLSISNGAGLGGCSGIANETMRVRTFDTFAAAEAATPATNQPFYIIFED